MPSTSTTRATGWTCFDGWTITSTVTTWPGAAPERLAGRHEEIAADALVLGDDDQHAVLVADAPDDPPLRALDHLHDLAFGTPAPVDAGDAPHHTVAVKNFLHLAERQEQIGAVFVSHEKPESVGMALHAPAYEVELRDDADRIAPVAHDLAVALHRREPALKSLALFPLYADELREILLLYRNALLVQRLEDVFAARQRLVVAQALALVERVAPAPRGRRRSPPHTPCGSRFSLGFHLYGIGVFG